MDSSQSACHDVHVRRANRSDIFCVGSTSRETRSPRRGGGFLIKFTCTYSVERHALSSDIAHAPRILGFQKLFLRLVHGSNEAFPVRVADFELLISGTDRLTIAWTNVLRRSWSMTICACQISFRSDSECRYSSLIGEGWGGILSDRETLQGAHARWIR